MALKNNCESWNLGSSQLYSCGAEFPLTTHEANKIMHIALPIGNSILMANDVPEIMGRTNENENRSKIVISAESKEEADKLFNGLSAGGQIEFPISDSRWVPILACLETNTALNGWWILILIIKGNCKRTLETNKINRLSLLFRRPNEPLLLILNTC